MAIRARVRDIRGLTCPRFDELNRTSPSEMAHGPRFERANLTEVPQTRPLSTLSWQ